MPIIIDGKKTARDIRNEIKLEVEKITSEGKRAPHLAAILVGEDPASRTYVNSKIKACQEIGFSSSLLKFDADISEKFLLDEIEKLNRNPEIDGYIVQLPLPDHIDEHKVTLKVAPEKDADGFHPMNLGKMLIGLPTLLPATPYGILELIKRYEIPTEGKQILVIGRSLIVGRPLSILLSQKRQGGNATVTVAHSRTKNIRDLTGQADIVITALGQAHFLTADMVKEGVVIIDAGINSIEDASRKRGYRLVGDADFEAVSPKASYITPVPGGVGPMTIAMLLKNTLKAYQADF